MQDNRRHQISASQSIGGSAGTYVLGNVENGPFKNNGQSNNPTVVVVVNVKSAPTGTSPTLTINFQAGVDGINFQTLAQSSVLNAVGMARIVIHDVLEPQLQVTASVGGSGSPLFPNVDVDVFLTSPDS